MCNPDVLDRYVRGDGTALPAKMRTQILGTQLKFERL
jgi:hypothetical protein